MKKKTRKKKKLFIIISAIVLAALLFFITTNLLMIQAGKKKIVSDEEKKAFGADCILIFGAGVWNGDQPSHMLSDRLDEGIRLYRAGIAKKILVSGDHGRTEYDEVNVMKKYLMDSGIPSGDIFMDHAGFSTYDSIYRAMAVFGVKKAILVTQEYHIYRALFIARCLGIEALGAPADPRAYAGALYRNLREWIARDKDIFYCLFNAKPKYLGEPIDISGSGDVTNDR